MKINNLLISFIAIIGTAIISNAQVPNYVPANGLVGWWPFNGNANDESGNGNNGTVNGNTVISALGGSGGGGFYCQCASGTGSCNTTRSSGEISGPSQNSGGILLTQGTIGGGAITVRY